ncbi:hypothetical protein SPBR_01128 [Sporothrix brasiliensis 5110]|uniref:Uncharacterized protein n=1 Tax=Sporothrix brasiliensis 5110 TaxID=1398154 RepID=A0A0C2IT01_9PEZI|nr:uncharacterized protein SPBR_01128 [Sporothrix brasiliensis 5110]KIH89985.1 hypothetical protein SPBR_01128 [Sporothrix brasiliensis 5110]
MSTTKSEILALVAELFDRDPKVAIQIGEKANNLVHSIDKETAETVNERKELYRTAFKHVFVDTAFSPTASTLALFLVCPIEQLRDIVYKVTQNDTLTTFAVRHMAGSAITVLRSCR